MAVETKSYLIGKEAAVKQALRQMKEIGSKVIFVVDEQNKLYGTLSDGDIRKWILSEGSLQEPIHKVCNLHPTCVFEDFDLEEIKRVMLNKKIEAIPVVNRQLEVTEVLAWDCVFSGKIRKHRGRIDIPVVIMAGGKGTRLDPFTRILPKPLIPIGDKTILEIIMDKFAEYGVREFYLSVNHKSRMIKSYFEDIDTAYSIKYLEESEPLGTAGSLKLLSGRVKGAFLVTNCDTIVESEYDELVKFHNENRFDLTMVVSCRHYVIPFGVCEIENGGKLKGLKEKPEYDLLVNTGMYLMENRVLDLIPDGQSFNFNDLVACAQEGDYRIGAFPISEKSWFDTGQWEEYQKAIEHFKEKM